VAKLFKGLKAGFGFTGSLAEYLRERGTALLDQEMGLGEYLYLYSVVYYSWLGKDPGAGPSDVGDRWRSRKRDRRVMVWGEEHGDWSDPRSGVTGCA